MSPYVQPWYGEMPKIIFDRKSSVTCKQFHEKCGLCNTSSSPKCLKIGKDYTEAEVVELFGPCINKNGYRYYFLDDEKLIAKVEALWMIDTKRPKCLTRAS